MSVASNPALSHPEGFGKRLRHLAVGALFALVLLIPKILRVRRNPRSWMLFRIFCGVAGAALVVGGSITIPHVRRAFARMREIGGLQP